MAGQGHLLSSTVGCRTTGYAPLLPSNRRKLVFRSMPVTQGTETPHHLPATTSLIAAVRGFPLDANHAADGWISFKIGGI